MYRMVMTVHTDKIGLVALILVGAAWLVFGLIFLFRVRPAKVEVAKRAPVAIWGIVLQGVSIALVWNLRRSQWWPFPESVTGELMLAAIAVVLAWASSWWCFWSVQTLGKQWALQARVVKGHELITDGPYGIVRNPIYLGLFGLLVATGLVLSTWWALLATAVVYLIGTWIRIRAEERLLRELFGAQFDAYAARVKAFLPGLL